MSASSKPKAQTLAERLDKLNEFERQPIGPDQLEGGRRFAALFSGEHVAATEFVIGALFVKWGASAHDLIWGLILGNLLAVLSWAFICAPISVRVRLTLYWYARRIIGPGLTVVYNIVNAMLYCCLAAAMIGVSASAVIFAVNKIPSIPHITHPAFTDKLPPGPGWVIVVCLVGAVVITLAIAGFKKLSQFSQVCAPWMFLVFIAGAVASLPKLGEFHNASELWTLAETKIWTGQPYQSPLFETPIADMEESLNRKQLPAGLKAAFAANKLDLAESATFTSTQLGKEWTLTANGNTYVVKDQEGTLSVFKQLEKLGFWHLVFFAWFANLAMHVGLSDMALFRYARHWTYGFYSTFGMYLGHFLAWICAGVMGAAVAAELNPGEMAYTAAGFAGVLAVLIAGWTTANPTIYRAGLALQIVTPNWPRWAVTFAAGALTTVIGFFPAIFMKLLDFVAIYGLTLMPIGAVIVVEHWVFPKLGLRQYWADKRKLLVNPAALISWLAVLVLSFPIEQFTSDAVRCPMDILGIHLFFRWLPGWFIAAGLYIVLSRLWGAKAAPGELPEAPLTYESGPAAAATQPRGHLGPKAWLAGGAALLSLILCVALPLRLFVIGNGDPAAYETGMSTFKNWFMIVTVVYFIGAIVWAGEREKIKTKREVA